MTPSECVALGRALEELEAPKGREAMSEAGRSSAPGRPAETFVRRNERFDKREVVAPAVGMSTATYSRAKQLVNAAEQGDPIAAEQVKVMDRTGKVTRPYETWKGHKVNRGPEAPAARDSFGLADEAPPTKTEPKKPVNVKNHKGRKPIAAMEGAVATLSGLVIPMKTLAAEDFAELPDEVRTRWTKELAEVLSTLRRVRDLITE
jgi:hypothetical protein